MTQEDLKKLLKRYCLEPNKTFGQNFLLDEDILASIVDAADISSSDIILEVGPGIGNLTSMLAVKAGQVLCVEKDRQFKPILDALEKKHKNAKVVYGDILSLDFISELQKTHHRSERLRYKVVSNLPYYLTGAAFQLFLRDVSVRPISLTLLIQKEVAENVVARPGHTNLLSLSVQLIGLPRIMRLVPSSSFFPVPKVTSAVLHVEVPEKSLFADVDEEMFFRVARACFAGKRKQIHNSLASGFNFSQEKTLDILKSVEILPTERPQRLSVQDFINLSQAVFADE